MSEETHASERPLPPQQQHQDGSWGMALPTLLTLGGGLAALWLLENQTQAVSRTAHRASDAAEDFLGNAGDWAHERYDETSRRARLFARDAGHRASERAGEWREGLGDSLIAAGAKAAGLAGMLKALGSRTAHRVKDSARHNPSVREGSERARGAYAALRGQPYRRSDEHELGTMQMAMMGVALVAAGAAASYLLNSDQGAQRRRELRIRTQAVGRRAGEWAQELAESARVMAKRSGEPENQAE